MSAAAERDSRTPVLAARGVTKSFGGARALRGVDFTLYPGEVHALLGENGAGKTTLMNILSGAHAPDEGEIHVNGETVAFGDPREAQAAGIATIYQELDLVPSLDVAANLFLGHEILRNGFLDAKAMRDEARKRLSAIDLDIDIDRRVADLSIGHRQVVAIVKALSSASRVLIMDEPTAALTSAEVDRLFKIMRDLSARGVGIIYISHRLEEVPRVADRVTVMRDGLVAGVTAPKAPQAEIVQLLVGRPLGELYPKRGGAPGRRLLNLERARFRLTRERAGWQPPEDVTLRVHAGEIVGLAGVMGAGRTELLSALYGSGLEGRWEGVVEVAGAPARLASIRAARRAGVAFVTDDRRGSGLMLRMSVGRNLVMSILRRVTPFGFISGAREAAAAEHSFQQFDIRPHDPNIAAGALSGGNQQKVVLAKEVLGEPLLLLLDEPTRGVDVGAKGEIYARLRELAAQGLGVLVASSEMPELLGICDRIVVLRGGRTVAEFAAGVDEETVLAAASAEETFMSDVNAPPAIAPVAAAKKRPPRVDLLAIAVRFQSLIGLVLVAIGGVIFSPVRHGHILFLAPDNIANIIRAISETGIIAVGMTFVIITAGIDLSVGALLSLSSVVTATMMVSVGWGLAPTLLAVLAIGVAFGAAQGWISTRFRLEPFIVTLAGLQVARGLALVVSNNQYINISYGDGPGLAPPIFAILGDRLFGNTVPVATLVFIFFAVVATIVLNTTRFGRYIFAVGGNERAARLSGVPVTAMKISVYAITGLASAAAGIVHAGQFNFGSANDGTGYELTAIAAVVIGGTSLFGGSGSMVGTVAGSVMLGALANILQLNNINAALQLLATGAIIVLAAVLQSLVRRREGVSR